MSLDSVGHIQSAQPPSQCHFNSSDDDMLSQTHAVQDTTCSSNTYQPVTSDVSEDDHDRYEAETEEQRFATCEEDDIALLGKKIIPKRTLQSMAWACKLFKDWRMARNDRIIRNEHQQRLSLISFELKNLNDDELNYCLSRFLCEIRKQNGEEYPPRTLRQIVLLIQMYLNENGRSVNFLSDNIFKELRNTLDNLMKQCASRGLGLHVKQAQVISVDQENVLWDRGLLGSDSPNVLLNTLVYLLGLNFALRSGDEHRKLTVSQFEVGRNSSGEYLRYREKSSKSNKRGLKEINIVPKCVTAYESAVKGKCVVAIFKKYINLRPSDAADSLYLRPLTNPKPDQWYSCASIGINTLSKTIGVMCNKAGFEGFYSNHSLRATCATRLYAAGVDEQLIVERTGHRSSAVRHYKRTSDEQMKDLCEIVQHGKRNMDDKSESANRKVCKVDLSQKSVEISFNVKIN